MDTGHCKCVILTHDSGNKFAKIKRRGRKCRDLIWNDKYTKELVGGLVKSC